MNSPVLVVRGAWVLAIAEDGCGSLQLLWVSNGWTDPLHFSAFGSLGEYYKITLWIMCSVLNLSPCKLCLQQWDSVSKLKIKQVRVQFRVRPCVQSPHCQRQKGREGEPGRGGQRKETKQQESSHSDASVSEELHLLSMSQVLFTQAWRRETGIAAFSWS